jgi:hypothetical protein
MSDTAETDMVVAADTGDSGFIRNLVQLARRLERERDEARRERDELNNSLKCIEEYGTEEINAALCLRQKISQVLIERDDALKELNAARVGWSKALEERDELRALLKELAK